MDQAIARLVIECDGGQHNEDVDAARTRSIEGEGYRVLRLWNNDILANAEGVHSVIASALLDHHPRHGARQHRLGDGARAASPIKGEEGI